MPMGGSIQGSRRPGWLLTSSRRSAMRSLRCRTCEQSLPCKIAQHAQRIPSNGFAWGLELGREGVDDLTKRAAPVEPFQDADRGGTGEQNPLGRQQDPAVTHFVEAKAGVTLQRDDPV